MQMTSTDYRESLRRYKPRVWVDGQSIASVVDAPQLAPGINALGVTYDMALREELRADAACACRRRAARPSTACCTSTPAAAIC